MTPLPLTVISGYLGAGKTTLINALLAEPHGLRLTVMVNDFGAINIDQALIAEQSDDVIALTNGCVCCSMGADLFLAIGDVLDRAPRPDHLIIEASGIADPKAIADVAVAEPDLRYAGIITLVDAFNIVPLLKDPLVAPQVKQQIAVADLVVQTKKTTRVEAIDSEMMKSGLEPPDIITTNVISLLTLAAGKAPLAAEEAPHPDYVTWHHHPEDTIALDVLRDALAARPQGLFRLKGFVETDNGRQEIHAVGSQFAMSKASHAGAPALVALGLAAKVTHQDIEGWWLAIVADSQSVLATASVNP